LKSIFGTQKSLRLAVHPLKTAYDCLRSSEGQYTRNRTITVATPLRFPVENRCPQLAWRLTFGLLGMFKATYISHLRSIGVFCPQKTEKTDILDLLHHRSFHHVLSSRMVWETGLWVLGELQRMFSINIATKPEFDTGEAT
jgi:hypothetical protein